MKFGSIKVALKVEICVIDEIMILLDSQKFYCHILIFYLFKLGVQLVRIVILLLILLFEFILRHQIVQIIIIIIVILIHRKRR